MKGTRPDTSPWIARIGAAAASVALTLAVFYHGPQLVLLAGAQFLLIAWLALSLAASYANGIRLPITSLSVSVSLFWLWLGISLWWTRVPVTSVINFWWMGSMALAFWCYTLAPDRERTWLYLTRFALIGAVALCAYAMVQLLVLHEPPRSTFINIHSFAALMMLISLPLSAYFLAILRRGRSRRDALVVGACLAFILFTIACTEGRGTTLSLILGMAALLGLTWRSVGKRPSLILVAVLIGAYLAANILLHGGLSGSKLATLSDPASAGVPRFLIWKGSWEMLMANPWWGIGLGTYYLAWPPYRDPADSSLGFFVHNDYLQLWIEGGLPALLLLLAVFGSVIFLLVKFVSRPPLAVDAKLEASGLFCGLLAVAAHSAVDFNFYILPTTVLSGLVLGRFHECVAGASAHRERLLRPARMMRLPLYRAIAVFLALFPLFYFVSLATSDHLYRRGFTLATNGKLQEADAALTWGERLIPFDDKLLMMHADLYRHVLARLPRTAEAQRRPLYEAALAMLDEAESANPYRPLVHVVRARLLQDNQDFAGPDWRSQVEKAYVRALSLDPRYFAARAAYAELLLEEGRNMEAYGVLEQGMKYWYYPSPPVLAYYDFTADLAKQLGQRARATEIERQIEEVRAVIAATVPSRPVAPDLTLPTVASSK